MVKILAVPAEVHPTQESFLLEVLSRDRPGMEVTLLTGHSEEGEGEEFWNAARLWTYPARPSRVWMRALRSYLFDPRHVTETAKAIRELQPDVVLIRDLTVPLLVAWLLQPLVGFKLFYQRTYPHEYRWFDPRIAKLYRLPRLWMSLRRVENRLLHLLMRRCDAVLTISEAMNDQLVGEEGFERDRLEVYGMGVNTDLMEEYEQPPKSFAATERIRLGYSGTLGISRDLELMIEAFALSVDRDPTRRMELELYGGGAGDVDRLSAHAKSLGVVDLLHFTGELPRPEMLARLISCDLALNYIPEGPRYWVSCPTKQIEYLALGMPSVATDTVALVRALERKYGGIESGAADPESFSRAIDRAVHGLQELRAEARSARHPIRDEYSYDAMAGRLMELSR